MKWSVVSLACAELSRGAFSPVLSLHHAGWHGCSGICTFLQCAPCGGKDLETQLWLEVAMEDIFSALIEGATTVHTGSCSVQLDLFFLFDCLVNRGCTRLLPYPLPPLSF